jgi:hypothetical protein
MDIFHRVILGAINILCFVLVHMCNLAFYVQDRIKPLVYSPVASEKSWPKRKRIYNYFYFRVSFLKQLSVN